MRREEMAELVGNVVERRKRRLKVLEERFGPPPQARELSDEEFVEWFDKMMASSPVVTIVAQQPPATDWVEPGTAITGPAWFLALALPSTENAARDIGRYKKLTGKVNPLEEVMG